MKRHGIILLSCFCFITNAFASGEDRKIIEAADLNSPSSLQVLDSYSADGKFLNILKIRQKLLTLPYQEILELNENLQSDNKLTFLKKHIEHVISEMESKSIYNITEDIKIRNVPLLTGSPFYGGKKYNIKQLVPYSERMYFNNLRLRYNKKTGLVPVNEQYWKSESLKKDSRLGSMSIAIPDIFEPHISTIEKAWEYSLNGDMLSYFNIFSSMIPRQRVKRYEESQSQVCLNDSRVLLRNEHRIFCLDRATGIQMWSVSPDNTGREYYQSLRHPHRNPHGYEMLLENGILYTELSGRLMAVDTCSPQAATILWKKDLGEYILASKPVLYEKMIIVFLVNARGECWLAGFSCEKGDLKWSKYIGASSHLSPACTVDALKVGGRVIIATNYGVIVCADAKSGELLWLRKYASREYDIIEFQLSGKYLKNKFREEGFVEYDSQFLQMDKQGIIYYKPRESEHLYLLESGTGELIEDIQIDNNKYRLIDAHDQRMVLLEKPGTSASQTIIIVDMITGKDIYKKELSDGKLMGLKHLGSGKILLKLGESVFSVAAGDETVDCLRLQGSLSGWLIGYEDGLLFSEENRKISCYKESGFELLPLDDNMAVIMERSNALEEFKNRAMSNLDLSGMLDRIVKAGVLTNDIAEVLMANEAFFADPKQAVFLKGLNRYFGSDIVTVRGVDMRFSGLLDHISGNISDPVLRKSYFKAKSLKTDIDVKGGITTVVPVNVVHGPPVPDFFIVLNFDQLLCIDEAGMIRWSRLIYSKGVTNHLAFEKQIKVYLYYDSLIVNDGTNVLCFDVKSGIYMWSMTNKEVKDRSKLYNLSEDVKYDIVFAENKLYIIHGGRISIVEPATGYTSKTVDIGHIGIEDILVADGIMYILYSSSPFIQAIDLKLDIKNEYFFPETAYENIPPQILIAGRYILCYSAPCLYLINRETGIIECKEELGDYSEVYMETAADTVFVILPFGNIIAYKIEEGKMSEVANFYLGDIDSESLPWMSGGNPPYYVCGEILVVPTIARGECHLAGFDMRDINMLWKTRLEEASGYFVSLSGFVKTGDTIRFYLQTGMDDFSKHIDFTEYVNMKFEKKIQDWIYSRRYSTNIKNGNSKLDVTLPRVVSGLIVTPVMTETQKFYISATNSDVLRIERKE
jgi:outer membrane protein assembly factor BamB